MSLVRSRTIVFIHPSDELYGADRMLLQLVGALPFNLRAEVWLPVDLPHPASPLCERLHELDVVVKHVDLPILRRAYRRPRALLALAARMFRLTRGLRTVQPDAVYCTTSAAYLGIASARWARVPTVVGHVQEFWTGTDALVLGLLANRCDRLIAISRAVADDLPARLARRVVVVPNAVPDNGPIPFAPGGGPLHYVVASRWNGWKGHRTLLAAWDQAGCPGRLTVLGAAPTSGETVDVAQLASRVTRPDSVDIVGEVPDPVAYLARADVVIMPSDEPEPFGLVAIEGFALGRPVIASAAGGLAEIVTNGRDGWLFTPRDVKGLTAVLAGLTRDQVAAAGLEARASYEKSYTVERFVRQWRAAMHERVGGRYK